MKDRLSPYTDMEETGYILPLQLLAPLILLPLAAIACLLFRSINRNESFYLLLALNSLLLMATLFSQWPLGAANDNPYSPFFWNTGILLFTGLLFRSFLKKYIPVYWIQYLLVIHVTVITTLFFTNNLVPNMGWLSIAAAIELSLMALVSLVTLVHTRYLFLFESSLFWVAAGTLFYYLIVLAVEASLSFQWLDESLIKEKPPLMAAFAIVRLLFYLVSCILKPSTKK